MTSRRMPAAAFFALCGFSAFDVLVPAGGAELRAIPARAPARQSRPAASPADFRRPALGRAALRPATKG